MIILGIDPGVAKTGYGIIRGSECLGFGAITTEKDLPQEKRLEQIYKELKNVIKKHKPDVMAVENLFFFKNAKTALPVSEAKGVILLLAAQKKMRAIQITPLQVKMGICGYGRAEKKQVQEMVKKILNLEKIPRPNHAADALGVAICCSRIVENYS